jgi:hypothetical protein
MIAEQLGKLGGWALAPVTGAVAALRRSRMFHPDGVVVRAEVEPVAQSGNLRKLAARLQGPALARLSSAWWKGRKEWPDDLGFALRFRSSTAISEDPEPGDQDLLFATIQSPWTTVLAALTTHVHDFLDNDYFAVSPFWVEGVGSLKWRLRSSRPEPRGDTRVARLMAAMGD